MDLGADCLDLISPALFGSRFLSGCDSFLKVSIDECEVMIRQLFSFLEACKKERDRNKGNGLNEFDQKLLDEELKMQLEQVQNPDVRRLAMLFIYIGMRRGEYVVY